MWRRTHTQLVASLGVLGAPRTRYRAHFPDITLLPWAGVYPQWHTSSHSDSRPLVQNSTAFHFYIQNYPERQRGKISLSVDKLLREHLDRRRKLLIQGLDLRNSSRQHHCAKSCININNLYFKKVYFSEEAVFHFGATIILSTVVSYEKY